MKSNLQIFLDGINNPDLKLSQSQINKVKLLGMNLANQKFIEGVDNIKHTLCVAIQNLD